MKTVPTLYIGNSQHMDSIEDNSVDFIYTGPPYWNHLVYSDEKMQLGNIDSYEIFQSEIEKVWSECYRVLKPGSALCIQANDLYEHDGEIIIRRIPLVQDFSQRIIQKGFIPVNTVFWDSYVSVKSRRMPMEERHGARTHYRIPQRMQYLLFFMKKGDGHTMHTRYKDVLTHYYWQPFWKIKTQRKLLGSRVMYRLVRLILTRVPVLNIMDSPLFKKIQNRVVGDFRKDTTYPATSDDKVIQKILFDFTKEGDLVLDPFTGSGTTLRVASDMNRRCIGYEINSTAAEIVHTYLKGRVNIFKA